MAAVPAARPAAVDDHMQEPPKKRRKKADEKAPARRRLSFEEKATVVEDYTKNRITRKEARERLQNMSQSGFSRLVKEGAETLRQKHKMVRGRTSSKRAVPHIAAMEDLLASWIREARDIMASVGFSLNRRMVWKKAKELWQKCQQALPEADREVKEWIPYIGWFSRFKARYGLDATFNSPAEAKSVEADAVKGECSGYDVSRIYNMDETIIFYRCLPRFSYLRQKNQQVATGSQRILDRSRVVEALCCNADGSHKLPVYCIGPTADLGSHPVPSGAYFAASETAWMEGQHCQEWFDRVFVPSVHERHGNQADVLLLMRSCRQHTFHNPHANIRCLFIPQHRERAEPPLSTGVLGAFRNRFKASLAVEVLSALGKWNGQRNQEPASAAGINACKPPHLGDALELSVSSWKAISATNIMECWVAARVLSDHQQQSLTSKTQRVSAEGTAAIVPLLPPLYGWENLEVRRVVNAIEASRKDMETLDRDSLAQHNPHLAGSVFVQDSADYDETALCAAIAAWMHIEDDSTIQFDVLREVLDHFQARNPPRQVRNAHPSQTSAESMQQVSTSASTAVCSSATRQHPSPEEFAAVFQAIERVEAANSRFRLGLSAPLDVIRRTFVEARSRGTRA